MPARMRTEYVAARFASGPQTRCTIWGWAAECIGSPPPYAFIPGCASHGLHRMMRGGGDQARLFSIALSTTLRNSEATSTKAASPMHSNHAKAPNGVVPNAVFRNGT